ncbi:GntR family transcriptional regulator [Nitratireductor aquimarinus]|uniref:GntR family transcriptional regulator n=2 Tax=Nitratireductor aquimarinus TaxID=889300 RepID=A0ABU4AMR0_9HYPH|nr:GntR family transcriptional regulator [Nitratireductor aquimarinus]MDV6227527.1 GntR family transcriptional regulator [Nitratireductor aquimarinus]
MELSSPFPMEAVAIEKQTLHDQVANRIRDLIIEGHLAPGTRIDETTLVEQLGVSRTPFREALRTLAAEGLIIIRPSKGSIVRKLTAQDVFSMLELLAHLEKLAGRLICERASDAQIDGLLKLHEEMLKRYREGDRLPYYKLNQEFHSRVSELAGNESLRDVQANIQARLKRIRFLGNSKPAYWDSAVAEHEQMAAALRKRDGEALGQVMAQHLMNTWDRVKDHI